MQPSTLQEVPVPIQSDVQSLDGSLQRNFIGTKYEAQMSFQQLTISGYQQIMSIINTGAGVTYWNDQTALPVSPITFSGLATFTPSPYVRGASLLQQLDVIVRQS